MFVSQICWFGVGKVFLEVLRNSRYTEQEYPYVISILTDGEVLNPDKSETGN